MVQLQPAATSSDIIYPDSDGQPMADNTEQFRWIVVIKENLEILFAAIADVFVAGDLFWYPIQGLPRRQAPDIMVVFGRSKGKRGSYRQWLEDNIAPQVVFEILSPGNTLKEMQNKLLFYQRHGVEEYYIYDPEKVELTGLRREEEFLEPIEEMSGWVSPRLGVRFELTGETLIIYRPDGQRFLTFLELEQRALIAERRATEAEQRATEAEQRATEAEQQAESESQRALVAEARIQALEARLREAGIDPDRA